MIRFNNVRGDVFVDDRRADDRIMARDGLVLKSGGDYLIATTQSSSAEVMTQGKITRLEPYSYLRVSPTKFLHGKHGEFWIAARTKAFLWKLWTLAGGRM
jgi:hypothetical protein